jgi:dihydrolipoamide dehydrogenase
VAKQLSGGVGHLLKKNKVTVIMGEATLTAKGKVSVKTDKGTEELTAKSIILATGARAREPAGAGSRRRSGLVLQARAGAPDAEEAAGHRLGRHRHRICQLLQHAGRRYHGGRGDGPRAAGRRCRNLGLREKAFVKQGMKILEKATVKKLDRKPGKGVTAHIERTARPTTQEFDTVISAVGIVGNVENLGPGKLGVKIDRTHVVTDEYCRTGVEGLYAIGDVAGRALAGAQGQP